MLFHAVTLFLPLRSKKEVFLGRLVNLVRQKHKFCSLLVLSALALCYLSSMFKKIMDIMWLVQSHITVDGKSELENEKDGFAWLEEREKPRELAVVGAPYRGPKIMDS